MVIAAIVLFVCVAWTIQKTANMLETQQAVDEAQHQHGKSLALMAIAAVALLVILAGCPRNP